MSEVIIVDINSGIRQYFCEVVCRAHEEVVAYHVSDHFLVQIAISNFLPVRVLEQKKTIRMEKKTKIHLIIGL